MGKASSAKKVARAARAGGTKSSNQRKYLFPLSIAAIVIAGVAVIVVARGGFEAVSAESPTPNDHWHQAYGFYVCDSFLPPVPQEAQDRTGIHTHGDGIIHTHPFSNAYAGSKATLGVWGDTVGVDFGVDSWEVSGETYTDGYDCNGEPAQLAVYQWPIDDPSAEPEVFTSDFADIRLSSDRLAFTFAVVPEGAEVPRPDSQATVDQLDPLTDEVRGATGSTSTLAVPVPSSIADPAAAGAPTSSSAATPPSSQP